uniref:Cadherin domain-containing protein n=1 Tax=Mesocestoides corti TaxID=53468 RepID=A0A5K3EVQ0_MESCO
SGTTGGSHIGDGSEHGVEVTSRDRWCDFRLRGGVRALNDAPGDGSQSAHDFSVSIVATRNGSTGEQEEQDKDI